VSRKKWFRNKERFRDKELFCMLNEYQECSVTGTIYLHPMLRNGEEKNLFYGHPVNSRGSPKEYIFQLPLLCSTLFPVLSHLSYLNIHNISENE